MKNIKCKIQNVKIEPAFNFTFYIHRFSFYI